ncbi:MAG: efflux RND transporter periplasmic adaptor subunit [Candidatus Binatia bacterium]|nr:efflux RND transporter periplasmic adaptor subunit [Candidatus Binatia bacterium]
MRQNLRSCGLPLLILGLVLGCSSGGSQPEPDPARTASDNPYEVSASEALLQRLQLGSAQRKQVNRKIPVPARIEVDETRAVLLGSPVLGRVIQLPVREGEPVKRGQLLGVLHGADLTSAQEQFLKALAKKQLAQRAVERANVLLEGGVIGSAEVHRREVELVEATAEVAALRDRLAMLGMTPDAIASLEASRRIDSALRITAPIDGTLLDRKVVLGQVVQPGEALFEIADLSNLWLVADVPEQYASLLFPGQAVEGEIPALNGYVVRGTLSFVAATVDPQTHTIRVRMDIPNPDGRLKPAMMAKMVLLGPSEERTLVPLSAVVREGNQEFVFVQAGPNTFRLRPVTLGEELGDERVVLAGLDGHEQLVLNGAFHLNNERRVQKLRGEAS